MFIKKIKLKKFKDSRGFLLELLPDNYKKKFYYSILTSSKKKVIRGLHYDKDLSEEKIIFIIKGKILDVCVDLKKGRNYKKIHYNSLRKGESLYIPKGFAHGYRCIEKENILLYFLSKTYNPKKNRGIKWDDRILNIFWGIKKPILSTKDRNLPTFLTNKK
jgi:dTDP-4-dehydrorhamnose 3,5-epimerase